MKQFYNKVELLKEVEKATGFRIATITLWTWEKKGKFTPTGHMLVGKQVRPVYDTYKLKSLIAKAKRSLKEIEKSKERKLKD